VSSLELGSLLYKLGSVTVQARLELGSLLYKLDLNSAQLGSARIVCSPAWADVSSELMCLTVATRILLPILVVVGLNINAALTD
jgi:hypothetical protein